MSGVAAFKHSPAIGLTARETPATTEQLSLWNRPIVAIDRRLLSIDERFEAFHRANAHVYRLFVAVAREYLTETRSAHVGAKAVWEAIRWRYAIRTRGTSDIALDNSYTSRYARLAAATESDLREAFQFRRLRSRGA